MCGTGTEGETLGAADAPAVGEGDFSRCGESMQLAVGSDRTERLQTEDEVHVGTRGWSSGCWDSL